MQSRDAAMAAQLKPTHHTLLKTLKRLRLQGDMSIGMREDLGLVCKNTLFEMTNAAISMVLQEKILLYLLPLLSSRHSQLHVQPRVNRAFDKLVY